MAKVNIYHRNKNTVRTKARKPFRSGPVSKGVPFGRIILKRGSGALHATKGWRVA